MKRAKKIICSIVVLIQILSVLAGCGSSTAEEKQEVETTQAPTEEVTPTEVATEPAKVEMSTPDLAEYVQKRTVTITTEQKNGVSEVGSGFFIDDKGTVVTSYHVIDAAESITVEVSDGAKYDVRTIVDFSEIYDVAVLKLDLSENAYLDICKEKSRTGETVYAVGSSLGFLNGTFSDGIISSVSRSVGIIDCIQTTAAISNGNSGGPLVNSFGEVVGINAFAYENGENLNLAVAIDTLDNLSMDKSWNINQFREWYKKEIERSYQVWNYTTSEFELSKINTYQHVTGRTCGASAYDWDFLGGDFDGVVEGYFDSYGVYLYEYDVQEFDDYTEYLNSIGFSFLESEDFTEGTSYYYQNEFSGYCVDVFIMEGEDIIVIEPYSN